VGRVEDASPAFTRLVTVALSAAFFISGASALIFETLWFRQAGLAFGNSIWASSLVLSGYMAGLALGNALAARAGASIRNPVRAYALAEATIALTGVGLVYLFPVLGSALAPMFRPLLDRPWVLNPLRLLVAFVLLVIPSTLMGITLPLLVRSVAGIPTSGSGIRAASKETFGRVLGALYGWNTLGAMVGVLEGELFLVGRFGVRGTALAAGGLNLFAAAVAGLLAVGETEYGDRATQGVESPHHRTLTRVTGDHRTLTRIGRWLAAAFAAGFCLLALEVVWFRFLLLFIKGSSDAFALMLAVVLAGIALGGLAASAWMRLMPAAHRFVPVLGLLAAIVTLASYAAFPRALAPFGLSSISRPEDILRISLPLMLPVSFVSGMFFPMVGAALRAALTSDVEAAGVLTLVNTTGAAVGSLAAGFLLLPLLGIEKTIFAIALVYVIAGAMLTTRASRAAAAAAAAGCAIALAMFPFGLLSDRLIPILVNRWAEGEPERRLIAVREGLTETVVFFQRMLLGKPVSDVMLTNSFSMSTTGYGVRRYQKLYVWWPMAVHPSLKHALVIGYGVGNTTKALTDTAGVQTIDLVDLSRDILSMSPIVFPDERDQPLRDPRLHVHVEDGRYFLQTTDLQFDLITGEPPPPGIAGVENLYSREYFTLMRSRLAEGGIVTYWLPLSDLSDVSARAILRAFCDVFDDCSLWNGSGTNLMMVGGRAVQRGVPEQLFRAQWSTPVIAAEMKRLGVERPEQLGALFIGDAAFIQSLVRDAPPLTDDNPKLIDAPFSSPSAGPDLLA
jgi:spermidine synthase